MLRFGKILGIVIYLGLMNQAPTLLAETGIISGFLKDKKDGEALAYVNVSLKDGRYGAITNKSGYYVISGVPEGKYTIVFSMVGYKGEQREIEIRPNEKLRLDISMEEAPIPLKPVVVSGKRVRFEREVGVSLRHVEVRELKRVPGFIEKDLFRSLQLLPGVTAVSDFSSALYVRGGSADENLVLLDGVTLYNPYHVGGLFSTFNIDAIKSADLYTGGWAAQYGGRLSSVLDVETRAGNSKKFCGQGEMSFLSTKLVLEGPIKNGSWLISGRRTYFDAALRLANAMGLTEREFPYYFYDLHSKVNFELSDKSRITLAGFLGDDVLYPEDILLRWGNYSFSSKWRYVFNPRLFSTFIFTKSKYRTAIEVSEHGGSEFKLHDGIEDMGGKGDISYFLSDNHSQVFGFDYKQVKLFSKWTFAQDSIFDVEKKADWVSLYVQDKYQVRSRWISNIGLRLDYWSKGKECKVSPRIGLKYFLRPDFTIKGGWGHYYQFITIPSIEEGEIFEKLPVSVFQSWRLLGEELEPLYAAHYILGVEKWISEVTNFSVEAYYKEMRNLLEISFEDLFSQEIKAEKFTVGKGYAYGIEFLLKSENRWISYAYSITKRKFGDPETSSGWFAPPHDRRHSFNINFTHPFWDRWGIDVIWVYGSGLPYTGKIGKYQWANFDPWANEMGWMSWEYISGKRSGVRYPSYHRMDVGVSKEFEFKGMDWTAYLQVINVYNHKNILFCYWDNSASPPTLMGVTMLPIFPSVGIRVRF